MNVVVKLLYRLALASTHRIFFQNQEDLDLCLKHSLVPPSVCERIPGSGVDLSSFSPGTEESRGGVMDGFDDRGQAAESPSERPRVFLMFGRLLPKKGFFNFLQAARTMRARHGDRAAFWIVGSPDQNRPESLALYRELCKADAEGTVRLLPATDDVLPILHRVDVVVLPSTYNEGVPRSLLEALACGKPIVTTDWKGCRETVVSGQNGFLVPPNDQQALERVIQDLVLIEPETFSRMGLASRKLAESRFDERTVIRRYISTLEIAEVVGTDQLSNGHAPQIA